jgi:hypothetical protein
MKARILLTFFGTGVALTVAGCAVAPTAPTVMVLPGTQSSPSQFQIDNFACQQQAQALLAGAVQSANDQAAANIVVGTMMGAAVGALMGQGYYYGSDSVAWGAGTGLLIGGVASGGSSQVASYSLQQRFNIAYVQCMYQRGHQVPGWVRTRHQAPAVPPPPPNYPPPNYPPPAYSAPSYPPPGYPPPN